MELIKKSNRIASMLLCWMFISLGDLPATWASPVRGPFPADITIRDDVEVLLRFPYEVLLEDEAITGYIAIRNLSDEPLTVLSQYPYRVGDQIIYEFRSSSDSPVVSEAPYWPDWALMTSRNPLKHIGKSEYVWYDIDRIGYTVRMAPTGTREALAGIVTGPNEWAFSEWTPVRRIDERIEDGEVLTDFSTPMGALVVVQMSNVEGVNYIFLQRRRIARVPAGATPRAVWDNETGHLTIHFDEVDIPAAVFRITRPVEWTPETVPHMQVLEDLKAELERARDAGAPTPEPDPVAAPPADEVPSEPETAKDTVSPAAPPRSPEGVPSEPESEPPPDRRIWPLLLILLLVVGGTALVLKHKRQH